MPLWAVKLLLLAGVVAAIGGAFWWHGGVQYDKGYAKAQADIAAKVEQENKTIRSTRKVIRHETQGLDRAGIVRELCNAGWVRNPDKCPH